MPTVQTSKYENNITQPLFLIKSILRKQRDEPRCGEL
jgi:hypothetical protein